MDDEIKVRFLLCANCESVIPAAEAERAEHDFDTDDGELLVVIDYHCPECRTKLASWGTQ